MIEKKIVTIPGTEEALVEEAPPYNRGNFAYINVPGPYEKGVASIYYIAPPDPSWTPAERAAYIPGKADLLSRSVHEVWPGHFLQFLHANRNPSQDRGAVGGLRVRGRLGALLRRDDVGGGPRQRRCPKRTSGS